MQTVLKNWFQQLFWSAYIVTVGVATPERMRRAGLI